MTATLDLEYQVTRESAGQSNPCGVGLALVRKMVEGDQIMSSKSRMIAGCGGAVLALGLGGGIASAAPNTDAIVNSTCTYPQVMAALNAQDPVLGNKLANDSFANGFLQRLVASPPDGRRQLIGQVQAFPQAQQYTGVINQVASTCNDF